MFKSIKPALNMTFTRSDQDFGVNRGMTITAWSAETIHLMLMPDFMPRGGKV